MVFDCAMSLLAVDRWSERVRGETPASAVDVFFDEHFPDSRMERIYANMEFGTNPDHDRQQQSGGRYAPAACFLLRIGPLHVHHGVVVAVQRPHGACGSSAATSSSREAEAEGHHRVEDQVGVGGAGYHAEIVDVDGVVDAVDQGLAPAAGSPR